MSHALHWLHRNPAERDRLIADPGLLPTAVDEFLRVLAPVQFMSRTATRDVELGGQRIAAGERVMLAFAAANRDPAAFDRPAEMRLDRSPNRHVAFGSGVHRCVGAHLAKVEAVVMLDEILRRIPDYVIDEQAARRYPSIGAINGYIGMPRPSPARPRSARPSRWPHEARRVRIRAVRRSVRPRIVPARDDLYE